MSERWAVIFDVDGVLVDSYEAHFQSWQDVAREWSWEPMSRDFFVKSFGRTSREVIRDLYANKQLDERTVAELDRAKESMYRKAIAAEFPAMQGARELIDALLAADVPLAAGSSAPRENVEQTLRLLARREAFPVTVCGSDVERGKPDPEIFQRAAEQLGIDPTRCAVIDDARPGVQAARQGGMLSIGLMSTGHREEEYEEAHHVVRELSDLSPRVLRDWVERFANARLT